MDYLICPRLALSLILLTVVRCHMFGGGPPRFHKNVTCGLDTVLITQDCKQCFCTKGNRPAKCFQKPCEPHMKPGQCPSAALKLDDIGLCQPQSGGSCRTDSDCPGPQLCCMNYCKGSVCTNPVLSDQLGPPQRPGPFQGRQG